MATMLASTKEAETDMAISETQLIAKIKETINYPLAALVSRLSDLVSYKYLNSILNTVTSGVAGRPNLGHNKTELKRGSPHPSE